MENNNQPIGTPEVNNAPTELSTPPATESAPVINNTQPVAAPVAQPVQTAAPQQAYNPYQAAQPVQTTAPQQTYNPYQATYAYQSANTSKRSVGKIIALIIGILLILFGAFWLFATAMVFISEFNNYGEVEISIPVVIVFSLPLIIGIVLTVFGAKKKKSAMPVSTAPINYNANSKPTAYAAPVQNSAPVAPVVNTSATIPQPTTYTQANLVQNSAPVQTATPVASEATVVDTSATIPQPTAYTQAAPVQNATPVQTATPVTPVANTASSYQYTPTVAIQDDSMQLAKKTARNNGLIAIAIIAVMWLILLLSGYIFWYLLILPFIMSFNSLKNNIKSIAGWSGMILSVISVIGFFALLFA